MLLVDSDEITVVGRRRFDFALDLGGLVEKHKVGLSGPMANPNCGKKLLQG